jgi:hypothetical protein
MVGTISVPGEPLDNHIVRDGQVLDAEFGTQLDDDGVLRLTIHSRGGGAKSRNSDYNEGLETLLERLAETGARLIDAAVMSKATLQLDWSEKRLVLEDFPYPIDLGAVHDIGQLRNQLGQTQAKVGREPGARGGGNPTKRIQLLLDRDGGWPDNPKTIGDELAQGRASGLVPYYEFREELRERLREDLIGPGEENERITDSPFMQYIAGVLYPLRPDSHTHKLDGEIDVDETDDDKGNVPDPAITLANMRYPPTMGITFAVDPERAKTLSIRISAAMYRPVEVSDDAMEQEEVEPPDVDTHPDDHPGDRPETVVEWQREPIPENSTEINVGTPGDDQGDSELAEGLELYVRVRPPDDNGYISVTAALINRRTAKPGNRDAHCFFQPRIDVSSESAAPFICRPHTRQDLNDEELASYDLLYRHALTFAVGHGCSADWELEHGTERAQRVWSTFLPQYDLPVVQSNPDISSDCLQMKRIAEDDRSDLLVQFNDFCRDYDRWASDLENQLSTLPESNRQTGERHIKDCRKTVDRMRDGVELLGSDDTVWEAFRLANRAMLIQRSRYEWIENGSDAAGPQDDYNHRWYPFQLAFFLLCIKGIANKDSPDRELADLLWFPTGGGKTEAYYGLIAFTVLLRRLRDPKNGGGVTALMRYTMRLLTIDQFQRAALLICALEYIRRSEVGAKQLGREQISIGLWVGRDGTPLMRVEAKKALKSLRQGTELAEGNPVQLHACPWCGQKLDHRNYWFPDGNLKLLVTCSRPECEFSKEGSKGLPLPQFGLPVLLVDQDIYDYRPTLLIATSDKFASLPWREAVRSLFNHGHAEIPPELIVQDELHLISGPLGTMAGLYETVVDFLCTHEGARPKVIASTATIRRAAKQTTNLFQRDVRQFPPPGLDARNSYFAVEAPKDKRGSRLYTGLMAPGTSHSTLIVRTFAALLQAAKDIPAPDEVKDPYWTLVGFFNSLRVLGGARMLVQDDVGDRLAFLAEKYGSEKRDIDTSIELTSREPASRLPEHRAQMGKSLPDDDVLSVILATNMISVGINIERFGLMAVIGQPPSTSEYIQATSRVGRRYPGLILNVFNSSRSRDRSHYENFVGYHNAIYRQVESTSVTPFSPRARDRALHAIAVALARTLFDEFRPNAGAVAVLENEEKLDVIRKIILDRVDAVDPSERTATEAELNRFFDLWKDRAKADPQLVYSMPTQEGIALLGDFEKSGIDRSDPRPTLWSLRDVDLTSKLYLVRDK